MTTCGPASWERDPGDAEILERATSEGRVLVTLDKDFGELAVASGQSHRGIIGLVGFRAAEQGQVAASTLVRHGEELATGALVTVEPHRVRVRPPEIGE